MANSVIGALRVNLGLDSAQFQAGLKTAGGSLDSMAKKAAAFGAVVGTAISAALVGVSLEVKRTIDGMRDLTNAAQVSNTSVEGFQRLAYAAKTVGIESRKLSDIYKDVNDRLGDFWATGGGPMADFFENIAPKVGITADAFRDLSGPDALQLYYDTLVKAGASQQDLTFYLEAMASDVTALIPLLQNGGAGFKRLGDEASRFGVVISTETAQAAEAFRSNLERVTAAKDGLFIKLTAQLLPALENLSEQLLSFVNDEASVQAAADGIGKAFEWVAHSAMRITAGIQGMRAEISALATVGQKLAEFDFTGARDAWNAGQSEAATIIADMEKRIASGALNATSQGQIQRRISSAFGEAGQQSATKFLERFEKVTKEGGGRAGAATDPIAQEAARIFEATRTPLEQYQAQIARLNELLAAGAINQDTYNRAVAQAQDAFAKAEDAGNRANNTMAQIGQSIGQSFSNAFQGLIDGSKKVKDVLKDLLSQLASMAMNRAFQAIVGNIFGGGFKANTTAGKFFGAGGIPGFARGGTILPGGAGGIDSQLVAFRKSPNERVDITKPGQSISSGDQSSGPSVIEIALSPELLGQVLSQAKDQTIKIVSGNNKARHNRYQNGAQHG